MAKVLTTYRNYTTTDLKNRSSIPSSSNITEGIGEIYCSNISLNSVKTLLGCSTYSLKDICTHANVNGWSCYAPMERSYSNYGHFNSTFINNTPSSEYRLGDFAGYNQYATEPGWITNPNGTIVRVGYGNQAEFTVDVRIGEIDYQPEIEYVGNPQGVVVVIWETIDDVDYIIGWGSQSFETIKDVANITVATDPAYFPSGITQNMSNIKGAVYICDKSSFSSSSEIEETVACMVPNTDYFYISFVISTLTYLQVYADPTWTLTPTGGFFNLTSGECGVTEAVKSGSGPTYIIYYVALYDQSNNYIGGSTIYSGIYECGTNLSNYASPLYAYCGKTNVPAYGYRFEITIEEGV